MAIDLKDLRRLAEAATPGPWQTAGTLNPDSKFAVRFVWGPREKKYHQSGPCIAKDCLIVNAEFICASNPQTILELLDELENERNRADRLQAELERERNRSEMFMSELELHRKLGFGA